MYKNDKDYQITIFDAIWLKFLTKKFYQILNNQQYLEAESLGGTLNQQRTLTRTDEESFLFSNESLKIVQHSVSSKKLDGLDNSPVPEAAFMPKYLLNSVTYRELLCYTEFISEIRSSKTHC